MNLILLSKLSQLQILRSSFSFLLNIFNELFFYLLLLHSPNFFRRKFGKGNPFYHTTQNFLQLFLKSFPYFLFPQKASGERRPCTAKIAPSNRGANVKGFNSRLTLHQ
jgi:hypothetical protein